MKGWSRVTPMSGDTLEVVGRLNQPTGYTEEDVARAGKVLALHYVRTFTSVFNRAPVVPHGL